MILLFAYKLLFLWCRWEKVGNYFGTYTRNLDQKHRLQIPSKLNSSLPDCLYILRGFEGALEIYEEAAFNDLLARLSKLSYQNPTARTYIRLALSSATKLDVDAHGRITLPVEYLSRYNIGDQVVVIGVLDHFELWDAESYDAYLKLHAGEYEEVARLTDLDRQ